MKACKSGEIRRAAYTTKNGVRVKSTCIKDVGGKGKGKKVLPQPKKDKLGKYGYKDVVNKSDASRHRALSKAVKGHGALNIFRSLILIATFNKKTNPEASVIFRRDAYWVRAKYLQK